MPRPRREIAVEREPGVGGRVRGTKALGRRESPAWAGAGRLRRPGALGTCAGGALS